MEAELHIEDQSMESDVFLAMTNTFQRQWQEVQGYPDSQCKGPCYQGGNILILWMWLDLQHCPAVRSQGRWKHVFNSLSLWPVLDHSPCDGVAHTIGHLLPLLILSRITLIANSTWMGVSRFFPLLLGYFLIIILQPTRKIVSFVR